MTSKTFYGVCGAVLGRSNQEEENKDEYLLGDKNYVKEKGFYVHGFV